ncbi:MAG: hypothetical protein HYX75_23585 [Acidobacteria bacterium]|nr:hypothetical protein [Acidobacteriota bacterium]
MFFLVKIRVDLGRIAEFGRRIANREFDNSCIRWIFCLRNDPTVGYSIWETEDEAEFERKLGPYRPYYKELEISPVVLPNEAVEMIMKRLRSAATQ